MQIWWTTAIPPWVLFIVWFVAVILLGDWLVGSRTASAWLKRGEVWLVLTSVSGAVAFVCLFYPKGFVAVRRSGLVYRFPFRPVRSVPWETLEVARNLGMSRRNENGTRRPLLLPTLGVRWLRRRLIHAEIARRWAEARD